MSFYDDLQALEDALAAHRKEEIDRMVADIDHFFMAKPLIVVDEHRSVAQQTSGQAVCGECLQPLDNLWTGRFVIRYEDDRVVRQKEVCGRCADLLLPAGWRAIAQAKGLNI